MATDSFDAVVVGSGAGGGTAAYALTRAGWKVCVLEKGPHYKEADFFHDELVVCRRDTWTPNPLDEPNVEVKPGGEAERTRRGWIACCVGGGTVHMSGFFFRLRPEDLRLRSTWGAVAGTTVADWPIAWEELAPFYDEVERVIGVSGDASRHPDPRPRFPLGPIAVHPAAALIEEACSRLGVRAFPTPRAILSADYDGRKACEYCGFCGSYGCEIGAKSSTEVSFLRLAAKTGRLTLRDRATAIQVVADKRGRASAVVWEDAEGARHETKGRVIVLAASAIQTARLLLLSGLANASGLVGRNLMLATFTSGWGRFRLPHRGFSGQSREWPFLDRTVQDFYVAGGAGLPHPKAGTILFLLPHPNPIHQTERLARLRGDDPPAWGAELTRRMREFFLDTRTIEFEAFSETFPHDGAVVTLDPEVKDRRGLPVARFSADVHPASLAASDFLGAKGKDVLAAAGADEIGLAPDERTYGYLQAGTARMGTDPSRSVLGPTGRAHDVPNLYVADASGFPSIGGAPFTETIMANALRVASHIVTAGKRGDL